MERTRKFQLYTNAYVEPSVIVTALQTFQVIKRPGDSFTLTGGS